MGFLTREFNQEEDFSGPVIPGSARPNFVDSSIDQKTGKSRHGELDKVFFANRILNAFKTIRREAEKGDVVNGGAQEYNQFFS